MKVKKFDLQKIMISVGISVVLLGFAGCYSVPESIPEDLTAQELIQNGQNESDKGNYKAALAYYNTTAERYMDFPSIYVEARYEIAHIYMKQKKYDLAEPILNELLELYSISHPGTLPAAYRKLAELELERIPD